MIRIMRAVDTREQCNQKKRKQKKVSFESLQHTNAITSRILLLLEIGAFFVVLSKNGVCTPHSTSVVVRSKHVQRQK